MQSLRTVLIMALCKSMSKLKKAKPKAQIVRETSVGRMLKVLSSSLDATMNKELKQLDLNLSQFAVLMILLDEEGLTQAGIGKKIARPGYSTTRNIDALEKKELVERRTDERSRRSYRIYLTDQGHAIGPKLFAIVSRVNEGFLATLSAKEKEQLAAILKKLLNAKIG